MITGVVETGLFISMTSKVIIGAKKWDKGIVIKANFLKLAFLVCSSLYSALL